MALPDEIDPKQNNDNNKNETLEIIREEQTASPTHSVLLHGEVTKSQQQSLRPSPAVSHQADNENNVLQEIRVQPQPDPEPVKQQITEADVEKLLKEKENQLRQEFEKRMIKEVTTLIDRFDFILRNEQVRASYMLSEAHRERQEKVRALETQLECKNMAGLMYVMCSERKKCKVEKLKIIEDYSNYINSLHQILEDSQHLILNLSRGYKTAARVDHEWREKMKSVIEEFQNFIYHFAGGTPEENQYFFDLPKLLATRNSIVDNPNEDPIEKSLLGDGEAIEEESEEEEEKQWYERFDEECCPFIMYGDMADFKPDRRREVLKSVKAVKTAPTRWREYVFKDMYLKSKCTRADENKDEILSFYATSKWDCPLIRDETMELAAFSTVPPSGEVESVRRSHASSLKPESRRLTTTSIDARGMGGMGSILKIITSASASQRSQTKAVLLGARDSLEIASTTALREKHDKKSMDGKEKEKDKEKDNLNIGMRRTSFFEEAKFYDFDKEEIDQGLEQVSEMHSKAKVTTNESVASYKAELEHVDSLQVIPNHEPDLDHKINEEKICPIEQCQRRKVNSFMRSLPTYMKLSPFIHFQSNYEQYESCSPEQLEMLKKRIEEKKRREKEARRDPTLTDPLDEWRPSVEGVAIQTSGLDLDLAGHTVCGCRNPNVTPASSTGRVFDVEELIPIKQKLDAIAKECFYDEEIDFDRFKVIGEEEKTNPVQKEEKLKTFHHNFTSNRVQEIRAILKKHPSLCEMFQANTKC